MLFSAGVVAAVAGLVVAMPSPGTETSYKIGEPCTINWTPDTTGKWKQMNIQLMTGHDLNMTHLTTVAQNVDATDPNKAKFSYPCPAVNPTSKIYFYQFSSPNDTEKTWTTRFTIAGLKGETTEPTEKRVVRNGNEATVIPWGNGALVDPSKAVPAPAYLNSPQPATNSSTTPGTPYVNKTTVAKPATSLAPVPSINNSVVSDLITPATSSGGVPAAAAAAVAASSDATSEVWCPE